jgi:hypothetical protein
MSQASPPVFNYLMEYCSMSNINIQIQAGFAGGDQSAVDIVVVPPPTPPAPPVTINPISFLQDIDNNGTIELAEATGTVTFRCIVPSNVDISPTTTDSVLLVLPVYGALPNYPLSALGPYIANGVLSIPIPFVSGVFAVSITFTAGGVVQPTLSNSVIVEGRYVQLTRSVRHCVQIPYHWWHRSLPCHKTLMVTKLSR